jgi:hypothetical protein
MAALLTGRRYELTDVERSIIQSRVRVWVKTT